MTKIIYIQMIFLMTISLLNMMINMIPSYNKNIHPMILGILLFMFSIFNSLNLSIYMNNNWFSFIMFLIIISSMMILFLYFISFISNMMMSIKMNYLFMIPIKFTIMIMFFILMLIKFNNYFIWYNNFNEIMQINLMIKINLIDNKIQYMYMYMYNKNLMTLISMIYLFLCLTLIVKICIFKKYSIRKINYEKIYF